MTPSVSTVASDFINALINPLLLLLSAVGLVVFIWGLVEFIAGLNNIGGKKEAGKRHMLYGVIGMFIMFSAIGIFNLISITVNSLSPGTPATNSYTNTGPNAFGPN